MFERLARLFRKKAEATAPTRESPELQSPADTLHPAELQWQEAGQNEFGLRVLDCRPFTHGMISLTEDKEVAVRFNELRKSGCTEHVGQEPDDPVTWTCHLTFPYSGEVEDGTLFIAQEMEDKWDIYLYEGHLYFARSWTGKLCFKAAVAFTDRECVVSCVKSCASAEEDHTPGFSIRQVDFLIKRHLYRREVPHPVPRSIPESPRDIALYSFSIYGRWASFASFEDTTAVRLT